MTEPKLYAELSAWWPLFSAPADYEIEAADYRNLLEVYAVPPLQTLLELGSGGGNNASHLKQRFTMTLADRSPGMLAVSRQLNPECEHLQGDMRTLRTGRTFDAVFVHDAINYLTTTADLAAAMQTAYVHCRPGGLALLVPDYTADIHRAYTDRGGHDGSDGRAVRYLEWTFDPDPSDTTAVTEFAIVLRESDGTTRHVADRHVFGVFPESEWLRLLAETGFEAHAVTDPDEDGILRTCFIARRPA